MLWVKGEGTLWRKGDIVEGGEGMRGRRCCEGRGRGHCGRRGRNEGGGGHCCGRERQCCRGRGGDIVEGGEMTVVECKVAEVMELVDLLQVLLEV